MIAGADDPAQVVAQLAHAGAVAADSQVGGGLERPLRDRLGQRLHRAPAGAEAGIDREAAQLGELRADRRHGTGVAARDC